MVLCLVSHFLPFEFFYMHHFPSMFGFKYCCKLQRKAKGITKKKQFLKIGSEWHMMSLRIKILQHEIKQGCLIYHHRKMLRNRGIFLWQQRNHGQITVNSYFHRFHYWHIHECSYNCLIIVSTYMGRCLLKFGGLRTSRPRTLVC